ncbi:WD40 repeat-like protein [Rhizodiscina lignyota]|uniref:WD40 repeat-like protein n=1 Tax=Rhizodiscina lignyota TaxID=1504668 RepID=A0A9P4IAA2_9PEZI|nr:WD40 repeat-like protein [Rhizodiscina lignyota]
MAPQSRTQRMVGRSAFVPYFSKLKTTTYSDIAPSTRTANPLHSIKTLAWSPLGNFIATGAGDKTLRIWNPEKNQVKNSTELKGHEGGIERVAWNPIKEAELASVSSDGVVKFWDVRSRGVVWEQKFEGGGLTLAWKPDGQELVLGTKNASQNDILIPISRKTQSVLGTYKQDVQTNQTIFSWSGTELFATTGEGQVKIFDYPTMEQIHVLNAHTSACLALDMSPTGDYLAVTGSDALISLWDTADWVCPRTFSDMMEPARSVSFSFDGSYIVGNSTEGTTIDVGHVESGDVIHTVETGTSGGHGCVAWAPRNYMLAYAGENPQALMIVGGLGGAA